MLDLSVVFGTYNRLDLLMDCIGSIRKAVDDLSYEIIITDGGSTDGSLQFLQDLPDVKLIQHGELFGPVKAYNDAFHTAQGEFVAYINDDLVLRRGVLKEAILMLQKNPWIGVVSLPYRNPSGSVIRLPETSPNHSDRFPMACFGVLRKRVGDQAGWFPDSMYHYHGDSALCLAVQEVGLAIEPLPGGEAACEHKRANNAVRGAGWIIPGAKERSLYDGWIMQVMWGGWIPGRSEPAFDYDFLETIKGYYGHASDVVLFDRPGAMRDLPGYNIIRRHGWNMEIAIPEWRMKMGKVYFGVPPKLSLALRDYANLDTFVETGTFKGLTAVWASANFEKVYTIEAYKEYYDRTVSAHSKIKNITFIFGDTRKKLPEVLSKLDKPALIWLDAHWCGNSEISSGTDGECPLMDEIEALSKCGVRHYILIDDVHCFMGDLNKGSDPRLWPSVETIFNALHNGLPNYYITTLDDIIVAVPQKIKSVVLSHKNSEKVIVSTSNAYVKVLPAFAYWFNKYWNDRIPVKVLRFETRPPKLSPNFSNAAIGNQSDYTWSQAIKAWMVGYAPEQFVFMLEDYFLTARVDQAKFDALWNFMLENPKVVKIDLSGDLAKREHMEFKSYKVDRSNKVVRQVNSLIFDELIVANDNALYQTSIQAAIWRRDFMLKYLTDSESPWEFEKHGGNRVIADREAGKFDGFVLGTKTPVVQYVNAVGGEGRSPGRLDAKRVPEKMIEEMRKMGVLWE